MSKLIQSELGSIISLKGGRFRMGAKRVCQKDDGEEPVRTIFVSGFGMTAAASTNQQFRCFVEDTNHITTAEEFGWSVVFDPEGASMEKPGTWWRKAERACWHTPAGPGSSVDAIVDHPVVHVPW